jgi:hypothetical protein
LGFDGEVLAYSASELRRLASAVEEDACEFAFVGEAGVGVAGQRTAHAQNHLRMDSGTDR